MEQKKLTERIADVTRKFYQINEKARKSDLWIAIAMYTSQDDVYSSQKNYRDVFEYGLQLCYGGTGAVLLDKILTNLINHEKDEEKRRFKLIQKEAVMHIQKGSHPELFLCSLFSYLNADEINEVQSLLSDTFTADELKSLLEKPYVNEKSADEGGDSSDSPAQPFGFFNDVDKNTLLDQLKNEPPLVIAYILSLIEPQKASFILSNLSTGLQIETASKIALMDNPTIELFCNVLRLEKKLLSNAGKEYKNPDSDEFKKLLKIYLVRENAVNRAHELYKKASMLTAGGKEAFELTNKLITVMQGRAVDFNKTNPASFLKLLEEEHPKTTALILSVLEPQKASLILQFLSARLQCDVASRIALMDKSGLITQELRGDLSEIPEQEIRRIEKKLSSMFNKDCVLEGGIKKLADILMLVDSYTNKTIMDFMEKVYPELIGPINDYMFAFEDIVMLSDTAIQKVLRYSDIGDLVIALKDTSDEAREKIFNNISKRAAIMLKEDIECMKPVNSEETDRAKKKIVSVIRRMEEMGEIILAGNDD